MTSLRKICACCQCRPAKPRRRFCDGCYKRGAAHTSCPEQKGKPTGLERPAKLADTGLLIDDQNNLLIHPDGKREPVPGNFVFSFYFDAVRDDAGEPVKPLQLRVLRAVQPETTHASD